MASMTISRSPLEKESKSRLPILSCMAPTWPTEAVNSSRAKGPGISGAVLDRAEDRPVGQSGVDLEKTSP